MRYDERLTVPLRWWVQAVMLVATLWLAVAVATPPLVSSLVGLAGMALVAAAFLSYGAARITVEDGMLRAGRAHIDTRHVGTSTPLEPPAARALAGVDADARAYLLIRPYLKRAVRVEITDPADATPYWLLSTRHPDDLVAALRAATHTR